MIDFNKDSIFKLTPINKEEGKNEVDVMLVDGEEVVAAFKTIRDKVVVTNKRII